MPATTQNATEEQLETIRIIADKEAINALKESAADKKAGRTRSLHKFLAEIKVQD